MIRTVPEAGLIVPHCQDQGKQFFYRTSLPAAASLFILVLPSLLTLIFCGDFPADVLLYFVNLFSYGGKQDSKHIKEVHLWKTF